MAVLPGRAACGPVVLAWAPAPDPAARSLLGRELLGALLRELGEGDTRIARRCAHCGSADHGRPYTVSERAVVSLSYAEGVAVVAVARSTDAGAVGVDVEPASAGPLTGLAALFAPDPPPDVRGWTVIEAAVKADGRGLRVPPGEVRRSGSDGSILPGGERVLLPGGRVLEAAAVSAPAGFLISVAIDPRPGSGR
ncbi:4'-phosphopantetheinyl transferase family protein [Microbacterium tumbae]